jgi:hypothetical protein
MNMIKEYKMKRRVGTLVLMIVLCIAAVASAAGDGFAFAVPIDNHQAVNDLVGGIIKDTSGIERAVVTVREKDPSINISVLVVPSINGASNIRQYARGVVTAWGGKRVLLLIVPSAGLVELTATDDLAKLLTPNYLQTVLEASKEHKGKRAENIIKTVAGRIVASMDTAARAESPKPATVRQPIQSVVTEEDKGRLKTILYTIITFCILVAVLACYRVPLWSINSRRRSICRHALFDCDRFMRNLQTIYKLAADRLEALKILHPKIIWEEFSTTEIPTDLTELKKKVEVAERRASGIYIHKLLPDAIQRLARELSDLNGKCQAISHLYNRVHSAQESAVNLYKNAIPSFLKSLPPKIKGRNDLQADYDALEKRFNEIKFNENAVDVNWFDAEDLVGNICEGLADIGRTLDRELREVENARIEKQRKERERKEAKTKASKLINEIPKRLAEAEAAAKTERDRRKLAEARHEYERATVLLQSNQPDILDWILLYSMLNIIDHNCNTMIEGNIPTMNCGYQHPCSSHSVATHMSRDEVEPDKPMHSVTSVTSTWESHDDSMSISSGSDDSVSSATSSWGNDD